MVALHENMVLELCGSLRFLNHQHLFAITVQPDGRGAHLSPVIHKYTLCLERRRGHYVHGMQPIH